MNSLNLKTPPLAFFLMLSCTVLTAIGQLLWKRAVESLTLTAPWQLLNIFFFLGAIMYGSAFIFLLLAFQRGELTVLYPIMATSYVWVSLLSPFFFPSDAMNLWKWLGVACIVVSVSLLGFTEQQKTRVEGGEQQHQHQERQNQQQQQDRQQQEAAFSW